MYLAFGSLKRKNKKGSSPQARAPEKFQVREQPTPHKAQYTQPPLQGSSSLTIFSGLNFLFKILLQFLYMHTQKKKKIQVQAFSPIHMDTLVFLLVLKLQTVKLYFVNAMTIPSLVGHNQQVKLAKSCCLVSYGNIQSTLF